MSRSGGFWSEFGVAGYDEIGGRGLFCHDVADPAQVRASKWKRLARLRSVETFPGLVRIYIHGGDRVTRHDTYEAWREGQHDDLVLSLALACWCGERKAPEPEIIIGIASDALTSG